MLKGRLRHCAEQVGSGDALAEQTGIPRRTLETYLSGKAEPKASRLAAICEAAGVNGHWLLTGEGHWKQGTGVNGDPTLRIIPTVRSDIPPDLRPQSNSAMHAKQESEPTTGEEGLQPSESGSYPFPVPIQWLERQGLAGKPLILVEYRGDSMYPTIADGALVAIDKGDTVLNRDGLFVLDINGTPTPRRIQIEPGRGMTIKTDNPAYHDQHVDFTQAEKLEVQGAIVAIGNRVH